MSFPPSRHGALLPVAALALALTGCGAGSAGSADDSAISIVASTNVYGDIASAVAGDLATVTSVIDDPNQDPHEYEPSAQDRLRLDGADVVIENGGGYDPFVDTMLEASDSEPAVLTAVDISGLLGADEDHADESEEGHDHVEGFNEHVWYDFPTVDRLAQALSDELATIDPDNAATYTGNYQAFAAQLATLETTAADLATTSTGRGVAITEPVPLYLLDAVGLVNQTPEEFSEAVEEGTDVPPRVLQETLAVLSGGDVALLAYNTQAADGTTEEVQAAAEAAGVPVVDFTETLPEGTSYVDWQQRNLDGIAAALG